MHVYYRCMREKGLWRVGREAENKERERGE